MKTSFRYYYDKDFHFLFLEEMILLNNEYLAKRRANYRLRSYANLFNRDIRKLILNKKSKCKQCDSVLNLQIDHIASIVNGGSNTIDNIQILCSKCNTKKGKNNG